VYFRKEGRGLGEVTKFLVYNARKRQQGGDRAEQYFARTECVAGVQDMRFQELMPDVLHWLGVRKIHRLVSMSNAKYDAIVKAGIEVEQRLRIPDELVPLDAQVEIDAKMAAGYFTDGRVPDTGTLAKPKGTRTGVSAAGRPSAVAHLRRPATIRERCANILAAGLGGGLTHFRVEPSRLPPGRRLRGGGHAPAPSRTRHSLSQPVASSGRRRRGSRRRARGRAEPRARGRARARKNRPDRHECPARRGRRGDVALSGRAKPVRRSRAPRASPWRAFGCSRPGSSRAIRRAPGGLTAAAMMDPRGEPDGPRLPGVGSDPLAGLDGRVGLLKRLGRAMKGTPHLFDALRGRATQSRLDAPVILEAVLEVLEEIWPERMELDGVGLGDTWPHPAAAGSGPSAGLVPLHKLSQWLAYSLVEPLEDAGMSVSGLDQLTGLAEYRTGGLFVDLDVLVPKHPDVTGVTHAPDSQVIVEWRALTVALLDRLAPLVAARLGLKPDRASPDQGPGRRHLGGRPRAGRRPARRSATDSSRERRHVVLTGRPSHVQSRPRHRPPAGPSTSSADAHEEHEHVGISESIDRGSACCWPTR